MTKRKEDMAEAGAEKDRLKTSRLETRRTQQADILKHEQDRTEKAEKWKSDRIEAMKKRQVKFTEIEDSHQINKDSSKARREVVIMMFTLAEIFLLINNGVIVCTV